MHYRKLAFDLEERADRLDGAALDRKEREARLVRVRRAAS